MAGGVSTLGSFNFQRDRILGLRADLNLVQQQIATGKKGSIFASLGNRTQEAQRLRADISILDSYQKNIVTAEIRGKIMDDSIEEMVRIAQDLRDAITLNPAEGTTPDINTIQTLARTSFDFLQELLNAEINGRYLFAGSNISDMPFNNGDNLLTTTQNQLNDWFDGTQTVDQFLSNINGLNGTGLGYALDLNSAGSVKARIDDGRDIDYTVLANEAGFADLVRVTGVLANLEFPDLNDPFVTATTEEFYQVMNNLSSTLDGAIDSMTQSQARLAIARQNMNDTATRHKNESVALANLVSTIEDVDLAESVVRLQQIETQLNASYQTVSTVSQLSLVNFL